MISYYTLCTCFVWLHFLFELVGVLYADMPDVLRAWTCIDVWHGFIKSSNQLNYLVGSILSALHIDTDQSTCQVRLHWVRFILAKMASICILFNAMAANGVMAYIYNEECENRIGFWMSGKCSKAIEMLNLNVLHIFLGKFNWIHKMQNRFAINIYWNVVIDIRRVCS